LGVPDTVFPTFVILGLAYLFQKKKRLDLDPIIETALYLASPCLIFTSLSSSDYTAGSLLPVAISAAIVMLGCLALSRAAFAAAGLGDLDARTLPVMLMNAGNLGIPIVLFAFGEEAMGPVVAFFVTSAVFNYTLGIFIAARRSPDSGRPWLEVLRLPLVYAAVAGVAVGALGVRLPVIMLRAINTLGQAAIPLFLISLGMSLASIDPKSHLPSALLSASMRIGLGLVLGTTSAAILGIRGVARGVVILQSSMPPAVASFMLSQKYRCNPELVGATVFVGTAVSIATIPVVLWLVTQG